MQECGGGGPGGAEALLEPGTPGIDSCLLILVACGLIHLSRFGGMILWTLPMYMQPQVHHYFQPKAQFSL